MSAATAFLVSGLGDALAAVAHPSASRAAVSLVGLDGWIDGLGMWMWLDGFFVACGYGWMFIVYILICLLRHILYIYNFT